MTAASGAYIKFAYSKARDGDIDSPVARAAPWRRRGPGD